MRLALITGILCTASLLQAASAAEQNVCFNPRFEYSAQPAGYHELIAQNTIGSHTARVRVTTSCIDLHNADYISLATQFTCLTKGDPVAATTLGMGRQHCIVTNIVYEPGPRPAGY
ncbi:MAG TPA: hypothetical protein VKB71_13600 [Rhizomicrobium sp.]|nr:hypothetical protein [Rhizomicrobium sp.]